jgi:hypothetical protein
MGLSAMPFAIGQVQDAGLIFLSHMASNVATHHNSLRVAQGRASDDGEANSYLRDDAPARTAALLSTAVVLLGLSTACLGVLLVAVGRARLAKFVAYLPMPVIRCTRHPPVEPSYICLTRSVCLATTAAHECTAWGFRSCAEFFPLRN